MKVSKERGESQKEKRKMTQITLAYRIEELNELEDTIEQLKAQAEAIKDTIKEEMAVRNVEEMIVGDYIVKYLDILSTRFDTKRFKTEMGEGLYKEYCREVPSKRFTITH